MKQEFVIRAWGSKRCKATISAGTDKASIDVDASPQEMLEKQEVSEQAGLQFPGLLGRLISANAS